MTEQNRELSKDTMALVLRGNVSIAITEDEARLLEQLIENKQDLIRIRGRVIIRDAILYLVPIKDMEEAMYLRRGFWKGECGHWNERSAKKCLTCFY